MSTKIFIVEDELMHAETLKIAIAEAGFELAGECNNADIAFELIKKTMPDIVLVDIALPGFLNGITLAAKINQELSIQHIFTTSFTQEDIIQEAIETNPVGYLHKPIDSVNLIAAVQLATKNKTQKKQDNNSSELRSVFVKVGDKLVRVNINEILMVKADGDNCISLITEKKAVLSRTTLKDFCVQLPENFIQVHRSYYININLLDFFNEREQTASLKGKMAPVARNFRKNFLNAIQKI